MHNPLIAALLLLLLASTATANLNDCELVQINSTHWYFETNQTDLINGTYNYQAFANNISSDYRIIEVDIGGQPSNYNPPDPVNIANTTGNFWVNHTWSAGSGNVTDSYNVSQNGTWTNGSATLYFNATDVGAHGYSDITFWAYNSSGSGTLSAGSITQNTTVPNNAISITNTSDQTATTSDNVYVDYDATDADSDTPTFSCNRTDLFTDFSTATGKGNWTSTVGTYYIDFGVSDGYGSTSNYTMTITVTTSPPANIRDGVFGMLNASVPDNTTISDYKNETIITIESTLDWDAVTSGTWTTYKSSVQYCYDNNRRSGLRMSCDGDYTSATYIANVKTNITAYLPDLKTDPYQATVQFIVINFTNTSASEADKATFANSIAQNISEQTDHKFKIVVVESLSGLDSTYVAESPIIYKVLTTKADWIDFEATTLRGNSTKSRIYSGNETFISDLATYRTNVFNKMRNSHDTGDQYSETHSVKVVGGDIILYNNASSTANMTVASAVAGVYWDIHNDTLFNNSGGATIGFWVDAESFTYIVKESSFEKITYQTNASSLLWASPTTAETTVAYHNGSMTDSYLWGGIHTDLRVELWDPTYVKSNLIMIHYEWINASYIADYSDYEYIIIADKNSNEITNTINETNNTYGYISVAGYTDTQGWIDDTKDEVDDWVDNYSVNIFLDGIDFAVGGSNFSARMKVVADYIKDTKNKNLILNTYTAYGEFATYGDAVMKESAFARWDGTVDAPTYSYEAMSIEKDRADFYSSHNITALGMSFGALDDYDKMAYCAAAFGVLYGFDGNNRWRYGQPNFQSQRDINIYDFGSMLESSYAETSSSDWNRLYEKGRVHIDPVNHTWSIDDDKAVNNVSVNLTLYSGAEGSGDRNVYVYANGNTTQHIIPYYPGVDPVGSWVDRTVYLDATEHATHGHYYIYSYTLRAGTGGWNFMGVHESSTEKTGRHSWYNITAGNLPEDYGSIVWSSPYPRNKNWMANLTVNYTTSEYIDELTNRITQTTTSAATNYTTTISDAHDTAIPVWSGVVELTAYIGAKTYANDSGGSWVELGVDDVSNASSNSIAWNYTTIDSEQWGAVRQLISGNTYNYRYLLPHTSTQEILTASDEGAPTYSGAGTNTTEAETLCKFHIQYDDDNALHPNGQYIFATNNTGAWVNESAVNWTATPEWGNVTKTLNSTHGAVVGYRWYADDNLGTANNTPIYTLTVTDTTPPTSITGITNTTGNFYHNWTWTNPTDADFNYTTIYINDSWVANTSNEYYNLTADAHNQSTISTHSADTTGNVNSTWVNHTSIIPNNDPTNATITQFLFNGSADTDMNRTYSGTIELRINVSTDADDPSLNLTHNLTLHYANETYIATIDNTFNNSHAEPSEVYALIDFNTPPYYSETEEYTLKVTAIGDYSDTSETWLGANFTLRQVPNKPTLVAPANGAVGTSTNPALRVTVTDPDGDPMNVTFYQQGGTQIGSTQTGIANGSTASVVWSGRSYSTTYYWYAVAHDGTASTQSDTWHFTTQATTGGGGGGGVTHDIAITGCTDWNGNAGTTATIDFGYINDGEDSPVFTTNATEGTLDAATGIWTWATTAEDVGVYSWYFQVTNVYSNSDYCTVTVTVYTTTTPLNLDATTGNFWVDHTWNAVADASRYNVSINDVWHNQTATNYLNTIMSPHGWSNITLASYNATTGISSFISDDVQLPNNPVTITNYADQNVLVGDNVTVDLNYADLDGDTPTFSCSRTDLFTDFNTATGTGNWTTATNDTFEIDFGVSDGYGSISNCTMTVRVGSITVTESPMPIQMFALMFGMMILLVFYSFIRVDENNYTHILTAFAGGILSILLGLEVFDGVDFYGSTGWLASCSTGWIGLFLCAFGGIMILYAVVHAIDIVRTASEKL